jgi:hypothetical protein
MSERFDTEDRDWPSRPWIMAAIGAVGGLIVHLLTDTYNYSNPMPVWKQAATCFTIVGTVSFLLTVELRRWTWSLAFAVGWGAVIALIGWFTAQYNHHGEIIEFPFLSGILAVLIAAPLFQTIRDEGAWRFPYARLHRHAWTDAVIGAASLVFTGITFLLAFLIAALFDVIGIEAIQDLLDEEWFGWMLAGFAFGAALGLLRERDALVATLQKLVMVVLSVLAPVLAVALAAFLLSLPFTGLSGLWESDIPATPMLLLSGAGAILLVNAVIGNGKEERNPSRWLQYAALTLVVCVLPLAVLAAMSMGERISQYGWTPERIWGVVAVTIAIAYGLAAWWAVYKGRKDFDDALRPLQTNLAIGLCGLALFLALPILDFGAISTRSQISRLESGRVAVNEFDWAALKYDFGPAGRDALNRYAESGNSEERKLAGAVIRLDNRYEVERAVDADKRAERLETYVEVASPDIVLTEGLRRNIANMRECGEHMKCKLFRLDEHRLILLTVNKLTNGLERLILDERKFDGVAEKNYPQPDAKGLDMSQVTIEVRDVPTKQVFVNGQAVGDPFE